MSDSNQVVESLSALAPSLARLEKSETAVVRYELMSGSLVWSDEIPLGTGFDRDCLRYVFHYRTGLITGHPDPTLAPIWQEALRLFPSWIGFLPERTAYNQDLAAFFHAERSRVLRELGVDE